MLRCVRAELTKAFRNRMFVIALVIGLFICGLDVAQTAVEFSEAVKRILSLNIVGESKSTRGRSLFVNWIAITAFSFGNMVFYIVWPILAVLPYGWSYAEERKSGMYDQIVSRVGRKAYFVSKYVAVFVSGGAVVALPVLANLLATALVCPYYVLDVADHITPITNGFFLSRLFYTAPWVFALIWCCVEFLWGGVVSCICLMLGTKFRHQAMALLTPFIVFILLESVCSQLMRSDALGNGYYELSPLQLAMAAPLSENPGWLLFSYLGFFFALTFICGYREVVKRELV